MLACLLDNDAWMMSMLKNPEDMMHHIGPMMDHIQKNPVRPRSSSTASVTTTEKEKIMNSKNVFGNLSGANKFMDRLFRKADGVVWDLMTGRVGIKTADGIATLDGSGDDAQINVNLLDQFGMEIPAFAQSTPIAAVNVGDIIFFGSSDRPGWVIEKRGGTVSSSAPRPTRKRGSTAVVETEPATSTLPKFVLMKVDGTRSTWTPPKVTMLGMESGIMVLRSLLTMLPGGNAGLTGLQGALMPMLMMSQLSGDDGDDSGIDLEKILPMLLMGQVNAAPVVGPDGVAIAAPNPMAQMMPALMMMSMMKKGKTGSSNPFSRS